MSFSIYSKNIIFDLVLIAIITNAIFYSDKALACSSNDIGNCDKEGCNKIKGAIWNVQSKSCSLSDRAYEVETVCAEYKNNETAMKKCGRDFILGRFGSSKSDCSSAIDKLTSAGKDKKQSQKDSLKDTKSNLKDLKKDIQKSQEDLVDKINDIQNKIQEEDASFKEKQAQAAEEAQKAEADLAKAKRDGQGQLIKLRQSLVQAQVGIASLNSILNATIQAASSSVIQSTCNVAVRSRAKDSGIHLGGAGNAQQVQNLDALWNDCVNAEKLKAEAQVTKAKGDIESAKAARDGINEEIKMLTQSLAELDSQSQKMTALRAQKATDLQEAHTKKIQTLQAELARAQLLAQQKQMQAQAEAQSEQRQQMMNMFMDVSGNDTGMLYNQYKSACCQGSTAGDDNSNSDNSGCDNSIEGQYSFNGQLMNGAMQYYMMQGSQ